MGIDITNVVGDSYNILFKNKTLLTIALIGAILSSVFYAIVMASATSLRSLSTLDMGTIISYLVGMFAGVLVLFLIGIFVAATMMSAVAMGDKAELGAAAKRAKSRYLTLLGTCVVYVILAVIAAVLLILFIYLMGVYLTGAAATAIGVVGCIAILVLIAYASIRLTLTETAVVVGNKGVFESFGYSWAIAKGNWWGIFAVLIILGIIEGIAGGIVTVLNGIAGTFVQTFLAYPITIAIVLMYQQLAKPAKPAKKQGK